MELLLSQKNTLYKYIEEADLSPKDFEISTVLAGDDNIGFNLQYKYEDFYYKAYHKKDPLTHDYYTILSFSPGIGKKTDEYEIKGSKRFHELGDTLRKWLRDLKIEITSENLWENKIEDSFNELVFQMSGKEIPNDIEFIKETVKQIQEGIKTLNLPPAVEQKITINLNQTITYYQMDKSFDWFSYIFGTITSVAVNMTVDTATGAALLAIVGNIFRRLLNN